MSVEFVYKPISYTPTDLVNQFRKENMKYFSSKISFYGKLDPLAHGTTMLLIDDECKNQDKYKQMDKTYIFAVLFGISTDTYDPMGKIINIYQQPITNIDEITSYITNIKGEYEQYYPNYSYIKVRNKDNINKPLWWWSKNNRLSEITIPSKTVNIKEFKILDTFNLDSLTTSQIAINKVKEVNGDFRQTEIIKDWEKYYNYNKDLHLPVVIIETNVSSGTYIRSISHQIGAHFNIPSIAFEIYRKNVGEFSCKHLDSRNSILNKYIQ